MTSMPWVKLYTEMLDDPKLSSLTPGGKWLFVELILLAGECDQDGLILMDFKKIAWRLREDYDNLKAGLWVLGQEHLIEYDETKEDSIFIPAFSKRQDRPQSVKRQQWNDAQKRHRSKQNSVINDNDMSHVGIILTEGEREEEEEEEREEESSAHKPLDFDAIRVLIEKITGYPIPNTENDIKAINEFVKWEIIEPDLLDAVQFFRDNNKIARGPYSLRNSVQTARAKRIQKNGKKPFKDTKVWSEEC